MRFLTATCAGVLSLFISSSAAMGQFPQGLTAEIHYGENMIANLGCDAEDVFQFQGNPGDRIVAHVVELADFGGVCHVACYCFDQCIELHDEDDTTLAINCSPASGNSRNAARTGIGVVRLDANGTFQIRIRDIHSNGRGMYGVFLQRVNAPVRTEPLTIPDTRLVTLNKGEVRTFSFETEAGKDLKIEMTTTEGSVDPRLELYDPDGNAVALPEGGLIRVTTNKRGRYTLLAHDAVGEEGNCQLTIEQGNSAPLVTGSEEISALSGEPVTLELVAQDQDGDPLTYEWIQIGGPPVELAGMDGPSLQFEAPDVSEATLLAFHAAVSDGLASVDAFRVVAVQPPESKLLFFPQFGDGTSTEGRKLTTTFVLNNRSATTAVATLSFFDSEGAPQALPFPDGDASEIQVTLPGNATRVYATLGTSAPAKNGYSVVETQEGAVSGLVILNIEPQTEASLLPVEPGRDFALYVERSDTVETAIALVRPASSDAITLRLYDQNGVLADTKEYSSPETHEARFVNEIFDLPSPFRGLLVMESDAEFAPVGLRFGNGVLAPIPVVPHKRSASSD